MCTKSSPQIRLGISTLFQPPVLELDLASMSASLPIFDVAVAEGSVLSSTRNCNCYFYFPSLIILLTIAIVLVLLLLVDLPGLKNFQL